jgi:adenine-specific DNA-methyltransferase
VPDLSYGDADSQNMLIQGDNLEALKALLPYYAGQVKCIFIDPPYNTKSAFEHYDDNLEHSKWLSMMYPRLELLRELLAENGSIWITLDDNEIHYLKVITDEIFGRKNFLSNFIWKKSYGGGAKAKHFVGLHEHILGFAKNLDAFPELFLPPDEEVLKYYKFRDEKFAERGPYRLQPLATNSMDERPNLRYAIIADDGSEIWPQKQWQWSRDRVAVARAENGIVIVQKNGKYTASYKQYLKDKGGEERRTKPKSIVDGIYTQHGTQESVALFGQENKFSFPKPEKLIWTIFESCTQENDLILDSFLGSGTTAAVAHKMNRRYIGIEMGEHAATHCQPRLKKVVDGEQGGISEAVEWKGGSGFKFYKLGLPVFDAEGHINSEIRFPHLAAHIWFAETHTALSGKKNGKSPLLGVHDGTAYYLLYNGILGDKRPDAGNVLTGAILKDLPPHEGPKVIYGESSRLGAARLKAETITFKQTPYDVKAR